MMSQGVPVRENFNFGQNQTQAQGSMPTSFAMGISKAQDTGTAPAVSGRKYGKEQKQTKSRIGTLLASTCELGWYISASDGKKYKIVEKIEIDRKSGEASQPPESSNTTSDAIAVEQVRQAIRAEFAKGLKSLGINPGFHRVHLGSPTTNAESNSATRSHSVIDSVTSSTISPMLSEPTIILGSPMSVASAPSHAGNGGSAPGLLHLSQFTTATSPPRMSPQHIGNPKNLHASLGISRRMSILGHPRCTTI